MITVKLYHNLYQNSISFLLLHFATIILRCKLYDMKIYCGKEKVSCTVDTDQERPEVWILHWRRNSLGQDDQDDASNDGDTGDDLDDGVSDCCGR